GQRHSHSPLFPLQSTVKRGHPMGMWFISALLLLFTPSLSGAEEWAVRVLLKESAAAVYLKAHGPARIEEVGRQTVWHLPPGRGVQVAWEGRDGTVFRLRSDAGLFTIDGRPYRGSVEVWNTPSGLQVINQVTLEDYVRGVMKVETNPDWPFEALRAQAVVARTFALYERLANPEALYHLQATTASQVYRGVRGEDPRSDQAIRSTQGVVLTYRGRIIPAFYHAASGGWTEDAIEVWEAKYPFIVGVDDPFSTSAPLHEWRLTISRSEIREVLNQFGLHVGQIRRIKTVYRTRSGRVRQLRFWHGTGILDIEGKRLRQMLGPDRIRSTRFTVHQEGDEVIFVGEGWGHGVGLSQWGAKAMADRGYNYTQILKHYYPLASLMRLP
ncbi:MAG: SpoIID/LytB domain-containing protein, partial [Candidatus Methylomirabilales bacterium]